MILKMFRISKISDKIWPNTNLNRKVPRCFGEQFYNRMQIPRGLDGLRKYFDMIPLDELCRRAFLLQVPWWILSWSFVWRCFGLVFGAAFFPKILFARVGVPAGCSMADILITILRLTSVEV